MTSDLRRLIADGVAVFIVVNVRGSRPADGHLHEQVWNDVVRAIRGGPVWAGQKLADQDVFLLDAKASVTSRFDGEATAGLTALEQRLADFLSRERQPVHLAPIIRRSEQLAAAIESRMESHAEQEEAHGRLSGVAKEEYLTGTNLTGVPKAGLTDRSAHTPAVGRFTGFVGTVMLSHLSGTWLLPPISSLSLRASPGPPGSS